MQLKSFMTCGVLAAATATATALIGCDSSRPNPFPGQGFTMQYRDYIPMTATKVAESVGSTTYTSDGQGMTYIVDLSRLDQTTEKTAVPHVIASMLLLKGQTLTIDGTAQTIMLSGMNNVSATKITNTNLKPDATYEIYFEPKTK